MCVCAQQGGGHSESVCVCVCVWIGGRGAAGGESESREGVCVEGGQSRERVQAAKTEKTHLLMLWTITDCSGITTTVVFLSIF